MESLIVQDSNGVSTPKVGLADIPGLRLLCNETDNQEQQVSQPPTDKDTSSSSSVSSLRNTPHKSYTVQFKLQALDWYHSNGENKKQTSLKFGVDRKRIRDWLQNEQRLRAEPFSNLLKRRSSPGCPPYYKELDNAMIEWYKEQKSQGAKITNKDLKAKALEMAPQLGIQDAFKASMNWVLAWKRRNIEVFKEEEMVDEDKKEQTVSDQRTSASTSSDFEEHLRRLERVGVGLAGDGNTGDITNVTEALQANIIASRDTIHPDAGLGRHADIQEATQSTVNETPLSLNSHVNQLSTKLTTPTRTLENPALGTDTLLQKLSEHEQWLGLIQQTVSNLETEVTSKITQIKLVLEQLKTSMQQTRVRVQNSLSVGSKRPSTEDNNTQTKKARIS